MYFGDKIQLRHLSSGKLIVLDPSIVMPESTGWGIKTSKGGDTFEFMRVMSSGRDNKLGYMCNYREGLRLVFKFSGLKYYLHARNYRTEDESNEWEVSAHYSPVTWRINKYVSFNTRPDLIRYGVPLKIG